MCVVYIPCHRGLSHDGIAHEILKYPVESCAGLKLLGGGAGCPLQGLPIEQVLGEYSHWDVMRSPMG